MLSTLVSESGVRYRITREDLLWLARMVEYEGGLQEAPALLWTLAQRFVWIDRSRFRTLSALAQSFSQPINPIWRRDGEKCRPGGEFHGQPECTEARLDRRDRAAKRSWRALPQEIAEITAKWAMGQVTNPVPTATNWAAGRPVQGRDTAQAAIYLERHPGAERVLSYGGNWFIAEANTKNWPDDYVGLENRDGSVTTTVVTRPNPLVSFARGIGKGLRVT